MTDLSLTLRGGVLVDERYQNFPTSGASRERYSAVGQRWRRLLYDRCPYGHPLISFVNMPIRHLSYLELLLRRPNQEVLDAQLFCTKEFHRSLSERWSLYDAVRRKWRGELSKVRLHQRQHDHGFQRQQYWECCQLGTHARDCRLALAGGAA